MFNSNFFETSCAVRPIHSSHDGVLDTSLYFINPSLLAKRGVSQKIMDTLSHLALSAVALSLLFTVLHIVRSFIFWQNLPLISLFTPPGANQQSHPGNNGRSSLYWCQPCFVLKEQSGKEGSVCERTHLGKTPHPPQGFCEIWENERWNSGRKRRFQPPHPPTFGRNLPKKVFIGRLPLDDGAIAQRSEVILCDNEESDLPELLYDSPRLVRGPNNHSSLYNQWGPWFSWWWCW